MTFAYLILAHHQPQMLHRLISRLPANDAVYIHLDARSDLESFHFIQTSFPGRVNFIPNRTQAVWGSFSLVQASINLLDAAGDQFDYYVLLSGQDYPIAGEEKIRSFLEQHNGKSFIEYSLLPCNKMKERQGGMYRINRYHYFSGNEHKEFPPFSKKMILQPLFNRLAGGYLRFVRPMPQDMKPYWGSQWWMLHKNVVLHIKRMLQDKDIINFFRNTWIPDEVFFQTLLLNGDSALQQTVVNKNYRLIKWPEEGDKLGFVQHPHVLTEADKHLIQTSDCLFARKFDATSTPLLDWIDQQTARELAA